MGPGRSGKTYRRIRGAATPKGLEHVRVMRRQDPHTWSEIFLQRSAGVGGALRDNGFG